MTRSPGARHFLFPLLYAVLGAAAFLTVWTADPGFYYGFLDGRMWLGFDYLCIKAETEPRWYWALPRQHKYTRATLEGRRVAAALVTVDLVSWTWRCRGKSGPVNAESLAALIAANGWSREHPQQSRDAAEYVVTTLKSLRDGTFPPTRHHPYSLQTPVKYMETPVKALFTHFTGGGGSGVHCLWLLLAIWPGYLLAARKSLSKLRRSPWKAYGVTLVVIAGADAVLLGIHAIGAPGPLNEFLEVLLGLVNLPGVLLSGGLFVSPMAYAMSAAIVATLVSIVVTLFTCCRRPQPRPSP